MKKLILVVLAVFVMSGIASAATTLELKGQIRVYPEINNWGVTGGGIPPYLASTATAATRPSYQNTFVDQRARLHFNVKSNENVGGSVAFEIDSRWGLSSWSTGRGGDGGGLGADTTNVEVKHSFLWFTTGPLKITGGIQTFVDDAAGIIAAPADMAGFRADYALSKTSSFSAGAFVWWDRDTRNTDAVYFVPLTVKQQLGGGTATFFVYTIQDKSNYANIAAPATVTAPQGLSYGRRPNPIYSNATATAGTSTTAANYEKAQIYYTGLSYAGKAGNVNYYLMGVYNSGFFENIGTTRALATNDNVKISAFAANAKVDVKIGDGKLRLNGLYVTGTQASATDNSKYRGFVNAEQYQGANTTPLLQDDLVLIFGNPEQITNATYLVTDVNNNGDGVQVAYAAYDHNLSKKLNAKAVVGYAAADKGNNTNRKGKDIGTEYNAQLKYLFSENLTISGVYSYAVIGDYFNYKTGTATAEADNVYKFLLRFIYSF